MIDMTEEYGHIPDGFFLSPEEIETLRQSKRELSQYAREKLKELKQKQNKEND